ncbi:hypothetical protein AK812_SmicGene21019 [Symbiodinium microadriaticum]|uniref:EF-hand domain-containing protein n=1 Tax=Symbiodinium microadriaticum TaxID=2951 RepID=A0A1Q9DNJ5_SYMMI|nr:hypothetical protein AK812_SmicGene21019 [Symbiodinium microadriaticum]CAE7236090.1 unnamed protein product [Symbiodinium sp. KB8]CAE7380286.1 unnamed protein product [Symbiodinium microadriaticum]
MAARRRPAYKGRSYSRSFPGEATPPPSKAKRSSPTGEDVEASFLESFLADDIDGKDAETAEITGAVKPVASVPHVPPRPGFSKGKVQKASTLGDLSRVLEQTSQDDGSSPDGVDTTPGKEMQGSSRVLERRLSYAAESLGDVGAAIREEEPGLDWLEGFWGQVLAGSAPPPECKNLLRRSLPAWVDMYNRWQAQGDWKPGHAPAAMDTYVFQELLCLPLPKTMEVVRLFDPVGYAKLQHSKCTLDYRRVRVPVPAFFAAAIFLSTAIPKQQKIRFLLGMFDENDNGNLEITEFVDMLSSFFQGTACLFGLSEHPDMPKGAAKQQLGKTLFLRIMASASTRMSFWEAKSMLANGSAPFAIIEDWFLGGSGDPLSAPFAMLLERFSERAVGVQMWQPQQCKQLQLSHTAPVEPPVEADPMQDIACLSPSQIKVAHTVFNHCRSAGRWTISHAEAEQAVGPIDSTLWSQRLARALDETAAAQDTAGVSMAAFAKRLCSGASVRPLRMYQAWLKELDQLVRLQRELEESRTALKQFTAYISRPVLPTAVRKSLLEEYDSFQMRQVAESSPVRKRLFQSGQMGLDDFVMAVCPKDYRPKQGNQEVEQVVGDFLTMQLASQEKALAEKEAMFLEEQSLVATRPSFLKPPVSDTAWSSWIRVFDLLDVDGTWSLTFAKLAGSQLLPIEVCDYMCKNIGGTGLGGPRDGFSKEEFLQKMIDVGNCRPRKATLKQCRLCGAATDT